MRKNFKMIQTNHIHSSTQIHSTNYNHSIDVSHSISHFDPVNRFNPVNHLKPVNENKRINPNMLKLSNRELEVTQLILQEHSSKEIAKILSIGIASVNTHRRNIRDKLEVRNVAGIVRIAVESKLIYSK